MIRVLVVDDHPVLRAGLEAVLRAEPGFIPVGAAADGAETLRLLRRTRPDVVVLDRRLGEEDGLTLCRTLRAQPDPPQVVVYTAVDDDGLAAAADAAGAFAAVIKSADVDALFDTVRLAARRIPRRGGVARGHAHEEGGPPRDDQALPGQGPAHVQRDPRQRPRAVRLGGARPPTAFAAVKHVPRSGRPLGAQGPQGPVGPAIQADGRHARDHPRRPTAASTSRATPSRSSTSGPSARAFAAGRG